MQRITIEYDGTNKLGINNRDTLGYTGSSANGDE